jgi:hypothetical protein
MVIYSWHAWIVLENILNLGVGTLHQIGMDSLEGLGIETSFTGV